MGLLKEKVNNLNNKPMLSVLQSKDCDLPHPPVWMMRQAGRYLPEYQNTRKQAGGFLDLCYNSELAAEVTLQPIRRFGFDAAIIFADILLLPHAIGQKVWFEPGHGPRLTPLTTPEAILDFADNDIHKQLAPVYKALQLVREQLPNTTTLLGFCGAPWTVACYMLNGEGSKSWAEVRHHAYTNPKAMAQMLDVLASKSVEYLIEQIKAGADAVQIFDSWAGSVPPDLVDLLVIKPLLTITTKLKEQYPDVPIILFPKGVSKETLLKLATSGNSFECLALDEGVNLEWAAENLQPHKVIQGNLDNAILLTTPKIVAEQTNKMLSKIPKKGAYIVNLGHGVLPQTPIENVTTFIETVRDF